MLSGIYGSLRHPILWHRGRRCRLSSSGGGGGSVCRCHNLYSGQYLKNGLSDLIQIWHVDVTGPGGVLYSFVTLNSY